MAVAGWYADPYGAQGQLRYWDGAQWTANVMPRPTSVPLQGTAGAAAGATTAMNAQPQAAQTIQFQNQPVHESIPLGANTTASPTAGSYGYQAQAADPQYAAQAQVAAQANPYGAAQTQGYTQMANAYEAAAQGYAQAANAYDAAAQGYAQVGSQYDASQAYGQYDPNAQAAYGQAGASPYYQGYDQYGQVAPVQQVNAPEGSNRTLRLLAFVFAIISIVGILAMVVLVVLSFVGVLDLSYGYGLASSLFAAGPVAFVVALPLAWTIPMCIHTLGIMRGTKRNTVLFAVLMLLFCSLFSGVLLLIAKKDPKPLY